MWASNPLPRREGLADDGRLEQAEGEVYAELLDLPVAHCLEVLTDDVDVPVVHERSAWLQDWPCVVTEERPQVSLSLALRTLLQEHEVAHLLLLGHLGGIHLR